MYKPIILFLLFGCLTARFVHRVIRPQDKVVVGYQGERYKQMVDHEVEEFDKLTAKLEQDVQECMLRHITNPELARVTCLGDNFTRFEQRFLLTKFKIRSIFEHLVDLLVTQNCVIYESAAANCYKLLDDIKLLIINEYDVLAVIDANREKYIADGLKDADFDTFFELLVYLLEKLGQNEQEMEKLEEIMQGRLWVFYQENILHAKVVDHRNEHVESESDKTLEQLSTSVNKLIGEKFSNENGEYRQFIEIEGIPNPFEYDDEVLQAKMEQASEQRFQENKDKVAERFTLQLTGATPKTNRSDCSKSRDYEACIRQKIRDLFKEEVVKRQGILL